MTETPWGEEMALLEPLEIADLEAAPPAPIAPPSFPPDPVLLERVSCAVYWFCYRARDQEEACRTEGMISSWHRGMNRSGLFSCTARYHYDNATAAYAEVLAYWLEGFPGDAGAVLQCLVAGVVPFHLEDELRRFFAWIDHDPAKTAANKPYKASAMNLRLSLMQASLQVIQAKYEAACEEYGELWVVPSDEERQALRARAAKTWPPRKPKRVRRKNW